MILCKECKKCGKCGKPYSENSNYAEQCKDFEKKKLTVFAKIKQMNIDEMVDFFIKERLCDAMDICTDRNECKGCFKEMLEREAEE